METNPENKDIILSWICPELERKFIFPLSELHNAVEIFEVRVAHQAAPQTEAVMAVVAELVLGEWEDRLTHDERKAWMEKYGRPLAKGMICEIYRHDYNSKNNLLRHHKQVLVVGDDIPQISTEDETRPVVKLEKRTFRWGDVISFVPEELYGKSGHAFGGAFVWSCDSRFRNQISEQPVPLHDYRLFMESR